MTRRLEVIDLAHHSYSETLELQRQLRLARIDGRQSDDVLILVEHDPTYTLGRTTQPTSLPISHEMLRSRGAEVVEIERGGDVTWHGPGQLVGYPIMDLNEHQKDLHWYLRTLERALIQALVDLGVPGDVSVGKTGVWVEDRKIASIGIHVKQWVTMHGFALNIHPDLGWFDSIVPCGLTGVKMTSLQEELGDSSGDATLWNNARDQVVKQIGNAFGLATFSGNSAAHLEAIK